MRRLSLISLGFWFLTLSSVGLADPEEYASPLRFAVELHYGPIKYKSFFLDPATGADVSPSQSAAGFWAEWMPITKWGKIGVGVGYQYVFSRTALFSTGDTGSVSANVASLGASYRLDYFRNQYVVPYARFALAFVIPRQVNTVGSIETKPSNSTQQGTEVAFGGEVLLDWIEPRSAANLDRDQGINNMYLFAEYVSFNSPSSASLNLTTKGLRAGMRVEF